MDLNGGTTNNNASNARILTQLALAQPRLSMLLPSMAEALAVLAGSTLVIGALDAPFIHRWIYDKHVLVPGARVTFNGSIASEQYTSGHTTVVWPAMALFYPVLLLVFVVNLACLGYFLAHAGLVTDFTEPQNLFTLAINSPPSAGVAGGCGGGPKGAALVAPFHVSYAASWNHYFFEEAKRRPARGRGVKKRFWHRRGPVMGHDRMASTGSLVESPNGSSYKTLSENKHWL